MNPGAAQLESAWFQPLQLKCDFLVSSLCFQIQLVRYNEDLVRVEAENAMLRERMDEMVADREEGKIAGSPGPSGGPSGGSSNSGDGVNKRGDKKTPRGQSVDPAAKELGMGKTISAIGGAVYKL